MADKAIRHFDFNNDLVIDLRNPVVAEAYARWDEQRQALNAKNTFDVTVDDLKKQERLYDAFLVVARQNKAVSELT